MNPTSSMHGVSLVILEEEWKPGAQSSLGATLRSALPVRAEADNYGRWKRAAILLVALPMALSLALALLD